MSKAKINKPSGEAARLRTRHARLVAELTALGPELTAEMVVAAAESDPSSALYEMICSESADEAIHARRLDLARDVIRTVTVVVSGGGDPVPKRHYVHVERETGRGSYIVRERALTDADACASLTDEGRSGLRAWLRRYDDVPGLEAEARAVARALATSATAGRRAA